MTKDNPSKCKICGKEELNKYGVVCFHWDDGFNNLHLEFHTCKKCMSELIANKFNEGRKNEQ